jgi:glycosyltransferase involved in cell wall biosynthesis
VRIVLVEPYYGGSHRAWADGYVASSAHDVTLLTHEARFWKWRMHGAHLTLANAAADVLDKRPDVVLASSMMSAGAFIGAARATIGTAPIAVYFHQSQFSYPLSPLDRPDLTYPMVNWSSAATADLPIFNSEFHRALFFEEAERFLRQFPDRTHGALVRDVEQRSIVLPIGVDLARLGERSGPAQNDPPLILWNQRWEHDKGPDEFVEMIESLISRGIDFEVAVVGERFVSAPESFDRLPELLGGRLVAYGFLPDAEYVDLLRRCDIVVSTAHHEFFGIAVVEAMAAGAFPVLPRRLVYPDRVPTARHGTCIYEDHDDLVEKVQWAIDHREEAARIAAELAKTVQQYDWSVVAPAYDAVLEGLVRGT